jgi:hypothetical protein
LGVEPPQKKLEKPLLSEIVNLDSFEPKLDEKVRDVLQNKRVDVSKIAKSDDAFSIQMEELGDYVVLVKGNDVKDLKM